MQELKASKIRLHQLQLPPSIFQINEEHTTEQPFEI